MSARNSLRAKADRRKQRGAERGCVICGGRDVLRRSRSSVPDHSYTGVCRRHLSYAVGTIFGGAV